MLPISLLDIFKSWLIKEVSGSVPVLPALGIRFADEDLQKATTKVPEISETTSKVLPSCVSSSSIV